MEAVYQLFTSMPMFVVLFWLMLFLMDSKESDKSKKIYTVFLSVTVVNYLIHWIYFNNMYDIYYIFDSIWVFTSLAVYPIFYYYVRTLTIDTEYELKWLTILLPALSLSLLSLITYLNMGSEEIKLFTDNTLYHNRTNGEAITPLIKIQELRITLFSIIFTIQIVVVFILSLKHFHIFNEKVFDLYSNVEKREISNIRKMLYSLIFVSFISLFSNLFGKDFFLNHSYLLFIPSLLHSIALYGLSYVCYKQKFNISILNLELKDRNNSVDSTLNGDKMDSDEYSRLFKSLIVLFEDKKIFTNPELRLNDVAQMVGTNRTYISMLIKKRKGMTFADFVNEYRVSHSEQLLLSSRDQELLINDIAIASGFSGTSSFYRAFKKRHGIPPGRFRHQMEREESA